MHVKTKREQGGKEGEEKGGERGEERIYFMHSCYFLVKCSKTKKKGS